MNRLILAVLAALLPLTARAEPACPNPDALGTSRVLAIDASSTPHVGRKYYEETLPVGPRELVLTFDDGPWPTTTPKVLDILKAECVRATFFLLGRNAQAHPKLVKRELAEGHSVGHHSYSHPEITLRGLSDEAARADIDEGFAADDKAGYGTSAGAPRVPFFRFPGFADTRELDAWLAARHIEVFGADLWASDWVKMTPEQELALLMGRLQAAGRGIILLHDVKAQTAAMLPAFLRELKARHFRIVHVVPGHGPIATTVAPPGWHSETETSIATLWPKLVKHGARSPMPAGGGPAE